MACQEAMTELMHRVLDHEASDVEKSKLYQHLDTCEACNDHFKELDQVEDYLVHIERTPVPAGFSDKVMKQLPVRTKRKSMTFKWFQKHPLLVAAACFIILMSGYIVSLWQGPFNAYVNGSGKLAYVGHNTVVVPKGETVQGDIVVKNGKVKIDGKVKGNVVLINSQTMAASAGHVTGNIKVVHHILAWIWYHIKNGVNSILIIHWTIDSDGLLI